MNPLQTFYNNETQREAIHTFMVDTLKELAIEKTFNGEDTFGIMEAKQVVDDMFNKLEADYGIKKQPIVQDSR